MTLRKLPEVKAFDRPEHLETTVSPDILARWDLGVRAAESTDEATISIFDVIGQDPWTGGGTTAKRIDAALRSIGTKDVVVNINSPGGDLFEGLAIYNLLRAHPHKVTVRVMAIAASAASIIAMAGDEIQIARAGFFMVHNAWVIAMGNRHDLRDVADWLEPFDAAMADIYVARTGLEDKAIAKLLDNETWIGGSDAIAKGFADAYVPADQIKTDAAARAAGKDRLTLMRAESAFAKQGMSRKERRSLLAELTGVKPSADADAMPGAGELVAADVQRVISTLIQ